MDAHNLETRGVAASKIFVSLSSSLPIKWIGTIIKTSQNVGLNPRVFHGIPQSPYPQTNSAEYEARGEMFSASRVFAALTILDSGMTNGDWIIKHLPNLKARGIRTDVGLIGTKTAIEHIQTVQNLLSDSATSNQMFSSADEWLVYIVKELAG